VMTLTHKMFYVSVTLCEQKSTTEENVKKVTVHLTLTTRGTNRQDNNNATYAWNQPAG